MYFDSAPKTRKEDLFGSDILVDSLVSYINNSHIRMIVIKGLRRTGKSSLLNVSLNEMTTKYVKIDVRESPYDNKHEFMSYLIRNIKEAIGETIFQKIISHIKSITFSYKEMGATFYMENEENFLLFFNHLDKELKKKKTFFIIAFDEVQLLRRINFDYPLAAIYDNYPTIKLILTGSEIGLVDQLLGRKDAKSPLYGRAIIELETKKLNPEQINQFLAAGFNQIKKKITLQEIIEVIEVLDGIIGWATYYGWLRSNNFSHSESIPKIIEEGSKLTKRELESFLANRNKTIYLKLLKWISHGYTKWSLIKNQFIKNKMKISDRQLNLYLNELLNYGFIEKRNESYFVSDPLLVQALS